MTKFHTLSHYMDGRIRVDFCTDCGAEGLKLLEECSREIIHRLVPDETPIDLTKQTVK